MKKAFFWCSILSLAFRISATNANLPSTVVAWGEQSQSLPVGLSGIVEIQAGWQHSLARTTNGTVAGWGFNNQGALNIPSGLSNVVAVAAGGLHSLALRSD